MKGRIVIGDTEYVTAPEPYLSSCTGCVFDYDEAMCHRVRHEMRECDNFIYIVAEKEELEEQKQEKIMFKIGDKVRVVKKVICGQEGSACNWVDMMDNYIGKIYTIASIGDFGIKLADKNGFTFPEASLKLITKDSEIVEVEKKESVKFTGLNELLRYLADGNIVVDEKNYVAYKVDDNVLKYKESNVNVWKYCDTTLLDYGWYSKGGEPKKEWYEKEFKTCLCYVWDEDEESADRVALVYEYIKEEDYPFRTGSDAYQYAKPLTLAEVAKYCLECE